VTNFFNEVSSKKGRFFAGSQNPNKLLEPFSLKAALQAQDSVARGNNL